MPSCASSASAAGEGGVTTDEGADEEVEVFVERRGVELDGEVEEEVWRREALVRSGEVLNGRREEWEGAEERKGMAGEGRRQVDRGRREDRDERGRSRLERWRRDMLG